MMNGQIRLLFWFSDISVGQIFGWLMSLDKKTDTRMDKLTRVCIGAIRLNGYRVFPAGNCIVKLP